MLWESLIYVLRDSVMWQVLQQTLFCRPNDLQSDTENIWHGRNDQTWLVGIIDWKSGILCEVYLGFVSISIIKLNFDPLARMIGFPLIIPTRHVRSLRPCQIFSVSDWRSFGLQNRVCFKICHITESLSTEIKDSHNIQFCFFHSNVNI